MLELISEDVITVSDIDEESIKYDADVVAEEVLLVGSVKVIVGDRGPQGSLTPEDKSYLDAAVASTAADKIETELNKNITIANAAETLSNLNQVTLDRLQTEQDVLSTAISAVTATTQAEIAVTAALNAQAISDDAGGLVAARDVAEVSATSATVSAALATTKANEASISASEALASKDAAEISATTTTTKAEEASVSASTATTQAGVATVKAEEAATSAATATTKASEASVSAAAALVSEDSAAVSATTASTKASEASISEANAETYATTAFTQAGIATTKASEAAASETAAFTDAATAATQAGIAITKAIESADSASAALISKNEAATSAFNAESSATIATTQAGISTNKADEASTSATIALTQAGIATTQANAANTSAGVASTQAGVATTKADESSTSAAEALASKDAAAISATSADTSAITATTKASEAVNSAGSASTSETNAEIAANTATTQAEVSTTKASEASVSASSASTSATTAITKAGEASASADSALISEDAAFNSAATATTQAGISTTKAGEASASADTATTQAGIATTKAAEAAASATYAANSAASMTPASSVTTQAYSDAGVVGTSTLYAREDHKHGTPAIPSLDALSNTTITSNSSGEILKWNGTAWVNNTLAEAGISPDGHTHSYQAADADLLAIAGLTGTSGLLKKVSADTWTLDTTAYTTNTGTVTSVTAGNGMTQSGTSTINPTLNVVSHEGSAGAIGTINVSADAIGVNLGITSTTACAGNDTRLSNARTPTAHTHGNISDTGTIGTTADLIVKTTTAGAVTTLAAGTASQYLRGDGTWSTPPDTNTTYSPATTVTTQDYSDAAVVGTSASYARQDHKHAMPAIYAHPTGDGNLHVPANGTTNNGKVLTAGATAGAISWQSLPASSGTVTSVTAGNGMTQSGTSTIDPTLNIVSHVGTAGSIGTLNIEADAIGVNLGTTSTTACAGDDSRLSNARTPTAHTHAYLPLTGGTMTGAITTPNSARGIYLGDDASIGDVDVANMTGLWGQQDLSMGGIVFGNGKDTNIYRGGANLLKTDDTFSAAGLKVLSNTQDPLEVCVIASSIGNAPFSIKALSTAYHAYQTFYQGNTGQLELGIVPTTADFYINPNVQISSTGAALYIKKSTGEVFISKTTSDGSGAKLQVNGGISSTGTIQTAGDFSIVSTTSSNANTWHNRIGAKNAAANKTTFIGTYLDRAVVGAHNYTATEWADLYINTVDGGSGGIVRLPSDVYIGGYTAITSGNIASQSVNYASSAGSAPANGGTSAACSGNSATATRVAATVSGTNIIELVRGNMADNDQFRIMVGGTASNAGYVEIATADDGNEPIYVRQYTGVFGTLARTATLLDGSGNTTFPGSITSGGVAVCLTNDSRLSDSRPANGGTSAAVSGTACSQTGDGWWRSTGATGWYSTSYSVGIYATEAGNVRTYNGANFIAAGNVTAYSDERVKTNWRDLPENFLVSLSEVKMGIYDRTDFEMTQVGVSAQSLQKFLPEAVLTHEEDKLSVAYGNAALVAAVELSKEVVALKAIVLNQQKQIDQLMALLTKGDK